MIDKPKVVLVHGAWVDATCWVAVAEKIERAGFDTVAVQLPLTSLADDAAALRATIADEDGPLLVVGHSYGGVVITEAADNEKVVGLVYVTAFAPDIGEAAGTLTDRYPPSRMNSEVELADGMLRLTRKGVDEGFAQDLDADRREEIFHNQARTAAAVLGAPVRNAAWNILPNWYLIATDDQAIPPALQRDLALKLRAKTGTVASSHVPMLSHPHAVAEFICGAAAAQPEA